MQVFSFLPSKILPDFIIIITLICYYYYFTVIVITHMLQALFCTLSLCNWPLGCWFSTLINKNLNELNRIDVVGLWATSARKLLTFYY
jgi:hypothetical protein